MIMAKKVAVLAVNPVNGCGLFQYLEAFFENGISYKVFAVSDTKDVPAESVHRSACSPEWYTLHNHTASGADSPPHRCFRSWNPDRTSLCNTIVTEPITAPSSCA